MNRTKPHVPRLTLAAALSALLLTVAALLAPASTRAEDYWVDGYRVGVTLRTLQPSYVLGEPVTLIVNFENHADTALELLLSGEQDGAGWPDDFEVTVTGPGGDRLPRPAPGERRDKYTYTNSFVRAVPAGQTSVISAGLSFDARDWAKIEKPGVYTADVRRGLRVGPYGRRYRLFPGTTKPPVELRLRAEFVVVTGGEGGLGKLVEELGASALACDSQASVIAATRLVALKDARAVKHLIGAMQRCKNASIRYQALGALAKYETDEAFGGLRLAASDADEDFRTVAAQLVSQSKHPKARPLLLSLRTDPYYGVRLMVLNALEAWDTAEARKLIWEMTNDEHPKVKEEALRFLQERAGHPPRKESRQ